jgi:hypothetical protein
MPHTDRTALPAVRTSIGRGAAIAFAVFARLARALACVVVWGLLISAPLAVASEVVYSWRDPGTGQLNLSSVPPPWLRSADAAERGPRVTVFKDGKLVPPERVGLGGRVLEPAPGKPGAAQPGAVAKAPDLPELLAKRDAAMDKLLSEALRVGSAAENQTFFVNLDRYLELCAQADAVDPAGAGTRGADRDRAMQRVKANIERVLRQPGPRTAFQNESTRWFSDKSDLAAQKIVRCLRDGYC